MDQVQLVKMLEFVTKLERAKQVWEGAKLGRDEA